MPLQQPNNLTTLQYHFTPSKLACLQLTTPSCPSSLVSNVPIRTAYRTWNNFVYLHIGADSDLLRRRSDEYTSSAEKTNAATYTPEKTPKNARVKKDKNQAMEDRNLRNTRSTQTSPTTEKGASASCESSISTSMADSSEGITTGSVSSTKAGRADRDAQNFVARSKDPRAVTKKD